MSNNTNRNPVQDVEKKVVKAIGKKIGKSIGLTLLKLAAPFMVVIAVIIMLPMVILAMFFPNVSHENGKTTDEEIIQRLNEYQELSITVKTNIEWLISMDMTKNENLNLLDMNINENAWHFVGIQEEKIVPEHQECTTTPNEDGEEVESCVTVPEKLLETKISEGKSEVSNYLSSYGISTDIVTTAIEKLENKISELNSHDPLEQYRFWIYSMPLDFAKDNANLDEDQKEYLDHIIEVGFIPEMFKEYGVTMWGGTSIGASAYCSPTKEVDSDKLTTILTSAGVFKGYEDKFISVSTKYGIDPVIMVAIALHETGFGTSSAVINKNNPGGLMGSSGLREYSTLDDGLEAMGLTLHNRIIKDGLTTIESLGSKYAPINAANDPTGLNQYWITNVSKIVNSLGGLTMNCESYSNGLIAFSGDVSEAAQKIATAGLKWINNSRYVFGGGRNPSDIAIGNFDCSSFVHWAYKQAGIELGNYTSVSTETLNKMGEKISISEIQVGDLIFWDTYKKDGHVGIYIGDGKFIGAQSSSGVAIESLSSNYWSSHFKGHVRRILE